MKNQKSFVAGPESGSLREDVTLIVHSPESTPKGVLCGTSRWFELLAEHDEPETRIERLPGKCRKYHFALDSSTRLLTTKINAMTSNSGIPVAIDVVVNEKGGESGDGKMPGWLFELLGGAKTAAEQTFISSGNAARQHPKIRSSLRVAGEYDEYREADDDDDGKKCDVARPRNEAPTQTPRRDKLEKHTTPEKREPTSDDNNEPFEYGGLIPMSVCLSEWSKRREKAVSKVACPLRDGPIKQSSNEEAEVTDTRKRVEMNTAKTRKGKAAAQRANVNATRKQPQKEGKRQAPIPETSGAEYYDREAVEEVPNVSAVVIGKAPEKANASGERRAHTHMVCGTPSDAHTNTPVPKKTDRFSAKFRNAAAAGSKPNTPTENRLTADPPNPHEKIPPLSPPEIEFRTLGEKVGDTTPEKNTQTENFDTPAKPNIPKALFDMMIEKIDPQLIAEVDRSFASEWVKHMARVDIIQRFAVNLQKHPHWLPFGLEWAKFRSETNEALKFDDYDSEALSVDVGFVLAPLKLVVPPKLIGALLGSHFESTLADEYEKIVQSSSLPSTDVSEEEEEQKALEAEIISAAPQKIKGPEPPPEPMRGFTAKLLEILVQRVDTSQGEAAVKVVKLAAEIATKLGMSLEPSDLGLSGRFLKLWAVTAKIAQKTARLPTRNKVTTELIEDFITNAEVFLGDGELLALQKLFHLHYKPDRLLMVSGPNQKRSLADVFMIVDGYGKLLRFDNTFYWSGAESSTPEKIFEKGRPTEKWRYFQHYVAVVLDGELARIIAEKKTKALVIESFAERQVATENLGELKIMAKRLCYGGVVAEICRFCLDDALEAASNPEPFTPRVFPKTSEQTEKVLLALCDNFAPESREPTSKMYRAYEAWCRDARETQKFASAATFCKDLYKQSDRFSWVMGHKEKFVCGVGLRESKHTATAETPKL